jgi:tetratricopeptide (TPR) repeat protein
MLNVAAALLCLTCTIAYAQVPIVRQSSQSAQSARPQTESDEPTPESDLKAQQELQNGTALTRNGQFISAIPHLLAARGRVANEYAASFNLALCYVGTGEFVKAVSVLADLRRAGYDNADVNNLLAQGYVGDGQDQKAFEALERGASFTPTNEKLYMFVADACMGKQNYALGLRIVEFGLKNMASSARLHYERAMFLSQLDQLDNAKSDFELAQKLAPDSDTAFDAGSQQAMFAGDVAAGVRIARAGVSKGHQDFMLLALLGEALLRSGATPGQPEFEEARQALEKSIQLRPNYPSSQLVLGKLYLLEGRAPDSIVHLEIARNLGPNNPAVYSQLATAYRKTGDLPKAQDALTTLAKLNQEQAEKIRTAPGDRRAGYGEVRGTQAQH